MVAWLGFDDILVGPIDLKMKWLNLRNGLSFSKIETIL
jgi:hypothetical protein